MLRRHSSATLRGVFLATIVCLLTANCLGATLSWETIGLAADPRSVLQFANSVPVDKDSPVDVLYEELIYSIDDQNRVTQTARLVYRINSADGVTYWADVGRRWEPWYQARPEIEARVITPDGVSHALDPKTLTDSPASEDGADTYNDDRRYHGPLPAVSIGAVVEQQIASRDTSPFFAPAVVRRVRFGRNVAVHHTRVTVEAPANLPFRYAVHQLPNATVKKQEVVGKTVLTVEHGPIEAQEKPVPNLPPEIARRPHLDFSTAQSWQTVADAYARDVEPQIRTAEVAAVMPAKNNGATREQIIRLLVQRLHKEVRYTGVEFGNAKLVPQSPSEVLKRKYGDCKDKATLLVTMLRAAGIPAYLALLQTDSDVQDAEAEFPGLGLFDHAIVVVPGSPDLWIDATAQYSTVGSLPSWDQGRMALVIRPGTQSLVRTPEMKSSDALNSETREFFLAEYGPARVVETSRATGGLGSTLRRQYGGVINDDTRKSLENYVKSTYLAEALTNVSVSESSDLSKPFELRLEVAKAKRGYTSENDAAVVIFPASILNSLPRWFREDGEEDTNASGTRKKTPERADDFVLPEASITEWNYRIVLPAGLQPHGIPENKVLDIGPAKLTQEFKAENDGAVTAKIRFDTVQRRFTAGEARQMRAAVVRLQKLPGTVLAFDQKAYVLLKAGKTREALGGYRQLIALHPKEALHHVQLAGALLLAGLGEQARVEAREATRLEPNSALAYATLGWILEHNLIGQRFQRGFELEQAIQAYRKALELDPKDSNNRADLAILLEHDSQGVRYGSSAKLDDSVALYRELKASDKENTRFDDNLLFALLYAGRFKEVHELLTELPTSETRRSVRLAATAGLKGAAAAIAQSAEVSDNETERNTALYLASRLLVRMRRYPEGRQLMQAGVGSQTNSPQVLGLLNALSATQRLDQIPHTASRPEDAVRAFEATVFEGSAPQQVLRWASRNALDDDKTEQQHLEDIEKAQREVRVSLSKADLPYLVIADLTVTTSKAVSEGDDQTGYRVAVQHLGSQTSHFYVVRENGEYKVLAASDKQVAEIGREVLARLAKNDVAGARRWLDWTREEVQLKGGDDPLAGPPAPRFWTRGQEGDAAAMQDAAAALLVDDSSAKRAIPILVRGRNKAANDAERLKFDLALAHAYQKTENWAELAEVSHRLLQAEPRSDVALGFAVAALAELKNWGALDKALQERLRVLPDDLEAIRLSAVAAEMQSNYFKGREILRKLIDSGRATAMDMNNYAWAALFTPAVTKDDIEIAQRGLAMQNNTNFATMHTLACLYAEVGQTKEARDLLINSMQVGNLDEPNDAVWLGLGRIYEQYGEYEAARSVYNRVKNTDKQKRVTPMSNYALMLERMKFVEAELRKHNGTVGAN